MSDGGQLLPEGATLAARFVAARLSGEPLRDYPGALPATLAAAYAIQDAAIDLWPDDVAGWKSGLVQPQHRAAFGNAERIAGPIFDKQVRRASGDAVVDLPLFAGGFAAVEAEFVFRVGRDAPADQVVWSAAELAELVDAMFVGVESAGSPFAAINDLGPAVTASDFGNNAGLVVGAGVANWRDVAPASLTAETFIDGKSVGRGDASLIPGGVYAALAFIATNAAARGRPLRTGQFISTGAVTGVHAISVGQIAHADFGALGQIRCRAVKARPVPSDQRSERLKLL